MAKGKLNTTRSRRRTFSVVAYLIAVFTGTILFTLLFVGVGVNLSSNSRLALSTIGLTVITGTVGVLPALVVFLPATLIVFHWANRVGIYSVLHVAALAGAAALVTYLILYLVFVGGMTSMSVLISVGITISGCVAGFTYHWVNYLEFRNAVSKS